MAKRTCCLTLVLAAVLFGLWSLRTSHVHAAAAPPINLASPVRLQSHYSGADSSVLPLASGQVRVLALASDDFDGDGIADLAAGYGVNAGGGRVVFYRGSLDAFAPQSQQTAAAFARGDFVPPYQDGAQVVDIPVAPDFLAAGRFFGADGPSLLAAARGGTQIHVLAPGASGFEVKQSVDLQAPISALAAYDLHTGGFHEVLVGIRTAAGPQLAIYTGSAEGLALVAALPLTHDASSFTFGNLDGDTVNDALIVAGGEAWMLHGVNRALEPVRVSYPVAAAALGSFLFDRASLLQMALLSTDGTLHILAHTGIDSRRFTPTELGARRVATHAMTRPAPIPARYNVAWQEMESFPGAGRLDGAGNPPLLLRSRVSDTAADDLLLLGSGALSLLSHPDMNAGSGMLLNRIDLSGDAAAALPVRVDADGRTGIVFLKPGDTAPFVMAPSPRSVGPFTVNSNADTIHAGACAVALPSQCTLREAIIEANAGGGATINLPAGTISLTLGRIAPDYSGNTNGALYINSSVTLVGQVDGSGTPTTILNWGTPSSGSKDLLMNINSDITAPTGTTAATVSINNVILDGTGAQNNGVVGADADGGCLAFDTGTSGNSNLTLTNVTVRNCRTTKGSGGGIALFNLGNGGGTVTITNSTIQNNTASQAATAEVTGGGIWLADRTSMTMTNSKVLNNTAANASGTLPGSGGGITVFSAGANSRQTTIHGSQITGNSASGAGGGIYATAKMLVDQGTIISNNTASTTPSSSFNGGGIYANVESADVITLSKVSITGNSTTGNGGGIATGNDSGNALLVMSLSRLAGNSAGGSGSNFYNNNTAATVTNNWWGTNAPAGSITTLSGTGTTVFDPFLVLTHTASPAVILINGSSTLTGNLSKDNHGSLVSGLDAIAGLPIIFNGAVKGTIPQTQPEVLGSGATATATFNSNGSSGLGTANATVDGYVVAVNSNLIASAAEAGTTATITTVGAHGFQVGQSVAVSGVGVSGYNGTFAISAVTTTTFSYTATAGLGSSTGGTATTSILILQPPSITTAFSNPKTIAPGVTSTITFSITNGNILPIDAGFTDTLPTGLVVASTPAVSNTCSGTVTANAGAGSIAYSNSALAVGSCTIKVNVTSATDNSYTNSVTISSTVAGTGNTASDTLTVIRTPQISAAFGASTIPQNSSTTLTFTLTNPNTNVGYTGAGFKSAVSLPSGLIVSTPLNGLTNNCGGTATAVAGSSSINLTGVSLAANSSCTLVVSVTGTSPGVRSTSVTVTSSEAGDGNTSSPSVTVVAAPTIANSFGASSIPLNGTATLTFTLNNPNVAVDFTGLQFTDNLPAALVVADTPGVTNTCNGSVTANAGASSISLSGGTLAHSASCAVTVSVKGTAAGTASNAAGTPASTEGGTGAAATSANISVVAPPASSAAFSPSAIPVNGSSTLTFTITNPGANSVALSGIGFSTTLPTGVTIASVPNLSNNCGGSATATAGGSSIALSGGAIATPGNTCTVSASVTASQTGSLSASTGNLSSTNGGTGSSASSGTLSVGTAPSITASFGASTIPLNGTTSLTYNITNPNASLSVAGLAFTATVTLPGSIQVVNPASVNNTCGGTAGATSSSVSFSGGSLAGSGSCAVSVTVQGLSAGAVSSPVTVTSSSFGTGNTSTAQMTVVAPPGISANFASSIPLGGTTTLTFSINNPNTTSAGDLTGLAFTDTLPAGLAVASTPNLSNNCGGTANASASSISLSGGSLTHGSSCTVVVTVTGTAAGTASNTTGNIASTQGGSGSTASASVNVIAPPSISAGFNPGTIVLNGTSSLTFTIGNPVGNPATLTGVGFTNILPSGLTVSANTLATCGGTLTTSIPGTITLTGASIAAGGNCQFSVTVTGASIATYSDTTGNVTSANGGSGSTASAGLIVQGLPSNTALVSSLNPSNFGQSVTLTATVTGASGIATGTVNFKVDGVSIGTTSLNGSGAAVISTSTMAIGTRLVTATYSGDSTYAGSASSVLSQVVNQTSATVSLQSSANPSNLGQSVTFTATVTPQGGGVTPTSTVTFKDGVTTIGSGVLSSGVASFTTSSLSVGSHSITAVYGGDANYPSATSSALSQAVNKLTPTVTVASSVNPSVTGQLITFTATASGTAATPSGTVTVTADGSSIGTISLSGGTGTLSVALTATGSTRAIVAQYGGDGNYSPANSSPLSQAVNAASTTIAVSASSNPALAGANVTFNATVSVTSPGQGTPAGTVTFWDASTSLGTGTLSGGVATFSTSALSVGTHPITATYAPTAAFAGSTSPGMTETINSTGTAVALNSSQNPSVLGQSVGLTATVTASGGITPAGTVQFQVGGSNFGSPVTLDGTGTAILNTTALPGGTSIVTATYTSSNSLSPSTSGPLSQVVLVPITVQASPAGAQFIVDGTSYTAPQVFNWVAGSSHALGAPSPQALSGTSQLVFSAWSDSGAAAHPITVPTAAVTYTASFATQYLVQVSLNPTVGGSVTGAGFYTAGTTAILTATPAAGYAFAAWSGGATGTANPTSFTVNAPTTVGASFSSVAPQLSVAIGTRTDGTDPGTRNVNVTLTDIGSGPAYNAQITGITSITVLGGSGTVTLASGIPGPVPAATLNPSGGNVTVPLIFNWPSTATRVSIAFRMTATDASGTTSYPFTQTVTTFR
jgi:CSLREA domain-containing protein